MSRSLADRRPTWIEWGLLGSGLATFSGLGLFFTKILPEEPGLLDGSDVAQAISAPAVWLRVSRCSNWLENSIPATRHSWILH